MPAPLSRPQPGTQGSIERRLYLWLFDLAKAGAEPPTNGLIAERFGFRSTSTSARYLQFLESTGLIRVERTNCRRRIWIGELQRWLG